MKLQLVNNSIVKEVTIQHTSALSTYRVKSLNQLSNTPIKSCFKRICIFREHQTQICYCQRQFCIMLLTAFNRLMRHRFVFSVNFLSVYIMWKINPLKHRIHCMTTRVLNHNKLRLTKPPRNNFGKFY